MKPRVFYTPPIVLPLGDGTYRVAPGKPVERLTMDQACQMTGLSRRDLRDMLDDGFLHADRPAARRYWFFAEELHLFLLYTRAHPDFWKNVRTRLQWIAHNPFNMPPTPPDNGSARRAEQGDFFS